MARPFHDLDIDDSRPDALRHSTGEGAMMLPSLARLGLRLSSRNAVPRASYARLLQCKTFAAESIKVSVSLLVPCDRSL